MKFLALIEKNQNAIIGALIIHVLVFVWLNIQNISFYVIQPKEKTIATFDFTEITKPINNIDDKSSEPIAPIKLTNAASNYDQNQELSASQKQQLEQQIINEVKNYEQSQFQELGEDNPILKSKIFLESKKNQEDDILYKSLAKSSSATAKYFCRGRNMILQKIPSYLCNATGLVRLNIKVNSKGFVTDCRIDNIKTTTNDACLIKNALNYASNWRFNQDFEKSQKQDGWIEFTYISQ